ncbi:glycine oxidase [mine drainage metagenome]|uniref:Glycine oxidase n=1 Tax=mine drainage metagenome TaxID=410659 RepID=A0A1J5RKE2_9ZZZZ
MVVESKFVVIGAGALGLASAEALLRQGADVTVLERGSAGQEASWAGGGILSPLCPWDYSDEVNRLALRGMALFGGFAEALYQATGIDPEYQRSGMLVLPPSDIQAASTWCAKHGMNMEVQGGRVFLPDIAQVRNPRLMQALRARVDQLGGRIVEQCEVKQIVEGAGRVTQLVTTQGNFGADAYIVTAGAWSKVLLGEHALQADIKPIRGQMLLFKFDAPPLPHILLQKDLYLIPRRDGHLLVGSTLEDAGFDKSTTEEARLMLLRRAIALLPVLNGMPVIQHWAGLRPGSPGNIPTIGRHPQLSNLYINSGHFRYGVTMSPASVEVLLNVINGTPQPFDVSPYLWH